MTSTETPAAAPRFNPEPLGSWTEPKQYAVEQERLIKFARATHNTHPEIAAGQLGAPTFAAYPAMPVCDPLLSLIIPQEIKLAGLHGEQDFYFHRPITPGMTLVNKAIGIGFRPVGAGVLVTAKGESRTPDGELVTVQYVSIIMRKAQTPEPVGDDRPDHSISDEVRASTPVATYTTGFDPDTPPVYADASGDDFPIHTDEDFARKAGLPGIINHGLCTLSFVTNGLIERVCDNEPRRIKRLAARFAWIVMPDQQLTTNVWDAGERGGRHVYGFESTLPDGHVGLKAGLIEVE